MMKYKIKCIFLITIIASLVLTNCTNHTQLTKKIFRYNETAGIQSLDPAFAKNQSNMWAIHQLYNTLVQVNDSLHIVPSLAKRWQYSADKRVITFTLHTHIQFHPSQAFVPNTQRLLTAHDVVYSYSRLLSPQVASPGAWLFNGKVDTVAPFTAINDSVFQLKLLQPFQPILGILSTQYCSIVPHEVVEFYGTDFRSHPCGTGPFMLEQWQEGQGLTMIRNPTYYEHDSAGIPLPYLDGIKVSFYDSKAAEFLLFRKNKIDFINDIDASFKDEILTKKGTLKPNWQGTIKVNKHAYLNVEYLGILVDAANPLVKLSPLNITKVRQAISCGFNKEKLMLYLRNSIGTAATSGMVPMGLPSFNASMVPGYSYNPTKALQLLTQAGYPNGKGLPSIALSTIPAYADLATYIAKELELIGIKVVVDVMQKSLLLEKTSKSQATFFRGSWIADYPDAENYLALCYSKNPAPPNYTRYNNKAYDLLYEQAISETNEQAKYKLYQQMDKIIVQDAPLIPLWYDEAIHLVQPSITGFAPNALNMLELRKCIK